MREFSHPAIDALRDAGEELRQQAAISADERRLSDAAAKILRETGAMRLIQPARYGGLEADPRCFVEAMMAAGEYDGAAGWVLGVVGVHNWHIGLYADSVQTEVWGEDPDTWISSSYNYVGRATRVDGGHQLSGRWGFSSGCEHAQWVFVGGVVYDGDRPLEMRHFLLPRVDYEIIDVWNVAGLSGSGSNDIQVTDMFVPDPHSMSWPDLQAHRCPGTEVNTSALFRVPWGSMFLNAVTAPLVGMARGMLNESVSMVKQRVAGYIPPGPATGPFDAKRIWPAVSMAKLAEVSAEIDAARVQMLDNLGEVYGYVSAAPAGSGGAAAVPLEIRARARRDQVMAAKRSTEAANTIFSLAGGRGLSLKSPVQRLWRDVQAGSHHVVNGSDQALTSYGAYLMGEPLEDMLV